jgi:hypothetical protein
LGDLYAVGRITLKWILKKKSVRMWTEFNWLRIEFSGQHCDTVKNFQVPKKAGEFLDKSSNYQLLKKDLALWSQMLKCRTKYCPDIWLQGLRKIQRPESGWSVSGNSNQLLPI